MWSKMVWMCMYVCYLFKYRKSIYKCYHTFIVKKSIIVFPKEMKENIGTELTSGLKYCKQDSFFLYLSSH